MDNLNLNDNILSNNWNKRYNAQPDYVKKQLDELRVKEAKEFQLRVIKRKRKYPKKGDVFLLNPQENLYYKGVVVNNHINNINGEDLILILISDIEYKSITDKDFSLNLRELLISPALVGYEYWTRGYFYTIDNIGNLSIKESYGFYSIGKKMFYDEYGNKLKQRPDIIGIYGVSTIVGIAREINREIIIKNKGINFRNKPWDFTEVTGKT